MSHYGRGLTSRRFDWGPGRGKRPRRSARHPALSCQRWRHAEVSSLGIVPGASEEARRVKIMNANWVAGPDGDDGRFELMIVTSDDRRHIAAPSPAAMTALVALTQADTVLVWDPADRTLIAANLRGTMPWTEDAATPPV
jgi:hypothetical protein